MTLVDANILLYAVDEDAPQHPAAKAWLEESLNGSARVGLPWQSLSAFVRVCTHPRALAHPLGAADAWEYVQDWLDAPVAWVPEPGPAHRELVGRLICELDLRGNLVSDAVLAALCLEHGLTIVSADSDFARFRDIAWLNPIGG